MEDFEGEGIVRDTGKFVKEDWERVVDCGRFELGIILVSFKVLMVF